MMTSHTNSTTVTASRRLGQPYVAAILALAGTGMLAAGIWAGAAPRSFARFVAFPDHEHFLHDLGAFQVGIGAVSLLVAAALVLRVRQRRTPAPVPDSWQAEPR
jgi:hypothetical protein